MQQQQQQQQQQEEDLPFLTPTTFATPHLQQLTHLYRGELGRNIGLRNRSDKASSWSVLAIGAVTATSFNNLDIPHYIYFVLFYLCLVFAWMDARRFSVYLQSRRRVRFMEQHMYAEVTGFVQPQKDGIWPLKLAKLYLDPPPMPPTYMIFLHRIRRLHGYLFIMVWGCWTMKLATSFDFTENESLGTTVLYITSTLVLFISLALIYIIVPAHIEAGGDQTLAKDENLG